MLSEVGADFSARYSTSPLPAVTAADLSCQSPFFPSSPTHPSIRLLPSPPLAPPPPPPGNTVTLQFSSGTHHISTWSDLTNAHPLPGPGIITGLSTIGRPLGRALLLLAEMSSNGNLATGSYTQSAVKMAREAGREFVVGFIAMRRVDEVEELDVEEDWLVMTPGVGLGSMGDGMGQQYRTPREVVCECGCDVIIVGRGIYGVEGGEGAVRDEAERYRLEGWKAYEERLRR